jgi:hypothetical protein
VWLAQEDLWLQRELLRIIHDANDAAATFKKADKAPEADRSKREVDRQIFTNAIWRLEVTLAENENRDRFIVKGRLTNISKRRQVIGISFAIGFHGTKATDLLTIDGEPLAPNQSAEAKVELGPQVGSPDALESVKQVFDWRTVPVKRIDQLRLTQHSARTAGRGFLAKQFPELKDEAGAAPTTAAPQASGPAKGFGTSAQGGTQSAETTDNGLNRIRYIEVTPEVRRLAVAMVLIIDQTYIQDVLTAFANSKLRVQTTQWHWNRFVGDIKPKQDETPGSVARTAGRTNPPPGGRDPDDVAMGMGPRGPQRPGVVLGGMGGLRRTAAASPGAGGEEQEWELMELTVYGVASLYERYPPKGATPVASVTPPAGATK